MVLQDGMWVPEKDYEKYPRKQWCDLDYITDFVLRSGYQPEHGLRNLVLNIGLSFLDDENSEEYNLYDKDSLMVDVNELSRYVEESGGGLEAFDYTV